MPALYNQNKMDCSEFINNLQKLVYMTKRFFTFAATFMAAATMVAVPVKRNKQQVKQPDGTVLTIMTVGDENYHYKCTEDRLPVIKCTDGTYCYAVLSANGVLVSSSQIAHNMEQRTGAELAYLASYSVEADKIRSAGIERASRRNATRMQRLMKRNTLLSGKQPMRSSTSGAWGGEGIGVTGKRKGLVILVNFKDTKMLSGHDQAEWNNYFNQEGYSKLGNSGSVHDYFKEQSYGQLDLDFDVVGPVTVSKNRKAYGANDEYGNDVDAGGMVYEACKLADSQVNFADYDWDGDGEVDQVYLIYAGYGEASTYNTDTDNIWQHEWTLSDQGYSLTLDGVKIDTYGCSSELNGDSGTKMDGIGTACHEFSHCMGIPDLYDTGYSNNFGMGDWDLMDYGSYAGDGYKPVGYNSYERWVSGWLQPKELDAACYVKDMAALTDSPEAYIVYNKQTPTEYYLLENRQLKGTDSELPNHGMLVIHVDYNKTAWENNTINNMQTHQRFSIVPADNKLTNETVAGDTYPGTSNNTSLTDTSRPAAKLFNSNTDGRRYLGKPITDIVEADGKVSFTFNGGASIDTPEETGSNEITPTSFKAVWTPVEGAESYSVQLREKGDQPSAEESFILGENMTGWGADQTSDGSTDISASLNDYMSNPGWTGEKVYVCPGQAKIGSSKKVGKLVSPLVKNHNSSFVTVCLASSAYANDVAETTVSLLDANDSEISSETIVPDGTMATVVLANASEKDFKVCIKPKKRGYVKSVAMYDGEFSADAFDSESAAAPAAISALGIARAASQQFDDITSTSYSFVNLSENGTYQWRVRAVAGEVVSAWTAWHTVVLTSESGIKTVDVASALSPSAMVEVYSMSGAFLGNMPYKEFSASAALRGAYILKAGGKTIKAIK